MTMEHNERQFNVCMRIARNARIRMKHATEIEQVTYWRTVWIGWTRRAYQYHGAK